jgi:hypothetical protein
MSETEEWCIVALPGKVMIATGYDTREEAEAAARETLEKARSLDTIHGGHIFDDTRLEVRRVIIPFRRPA